jgi:DNA-binding GntR family transcriptional regulator
MTDRMFLGLPGRLVKELLNGEPGPGPRTIIRTQAELGAVLGVSREAVNKALRALERQGLLVLGRGRVTVPDPSALLRLV